MSKISGSVGIKGKNLPADVGMVQAMLNAHVAHLGLRTIVVDRIIGPQTIRAIEEFQRRVVRLGRPDGHVSPDCRTFLALVGRNAALPTSPAGSNNLSGKAWWHANQSKYPNSAKIADLADDFRPKLQAFVAALEAPGATVAVSATRRNKVRAYLMHYSWDIFKNLVMPSAVPGQSGVTIIWDHGDLAKSKAAANEMVSLFGIVFRPSLTSRHIEGLAIDMNISWSGTLAIKNKDGTAVSIEAPRDGSNTTLHKVGKSYGVIKLLTDAPHWSSDGH